MTGWSMPCECEIWCGDSKCKPSPMSTLEAARQKEIERVAQALLAAIDAAHERGETFSARISICCEALKRSFENQARSQTPELGREEE